MAFATGKITCSTFFGLKIQYYAKVLGMCKFRKEKIL